MIDNENKIIKANWSLAFNQSDFDSVVILVNLWCTMYYMVYTWGPPVYC